MALEAMTSSECQHRHSPNYTHLKLRILHDDIGLSWSPDKVTAFWGQTWFIRLGAGACFLLFAAILLLNSLVLRYYVRKCGEVFPLLYTALSLCDIGNACSALLFGSLLLLVRADRVTSGVSVLVHFTYILFSVTSRVSIYYNTLLVVIRTVNVVTPTYVVPHRHVLVAILAGQILWLVISLLDMLGLKEVLRFFQDDAVQVTRYHVLIDTLITNPLTGFLVIFYVFDKLCLINHLNVVRVFVVLKGVPFILPCVLAVICMALQTYYLVIKSRVGRHSAISRRITVTVLYLTVAFVACNLPDFVLNLVLLGVIRLSFSQLPPYMCVVFVSGVMLPFLNSLLNPLILMLRGTSLKNSVLRCLCRRGSASEASSKLEVTVGRRSFKSGTGGRSFKSENGSSERYELQNM